MRDLGRQAPFELRGSRPQKLCAIAGRKGSPVINPAMTPRQLLSPQARAALFDPPREIRTIVRHYTFSREDLTLSADGGTRTRTTLSDQRILSPLRLPFRHIGSRADPQFNAVRPASQVRSWRLRSGGLEFNVDGVKPIPLGKRVLGGSIRAAGSV